MESKQRVAGMRVYHRTYHASAIMEEGFRDAECCYLTDQLWRGVWVSDRPLDERQGADGDRVLVLTIPEQALLPYEWVEPKGYREFLVPASLLNEYEPQWYEEPDFWLCPITIGGGSICGREAGSEDSNRSLILCEEHQEVDGLTLDAARGIWYDSRCWMPTAPGA
jgi:hypothetical protein